MVVFDVGYNGGLFQVIIVGMKLLLSLAAAALVAPASAGMDREVAEHVMELTFMSDCWGKPAMRLYMESLMGAAQRCLQMEPTLTEEDLFNTMLPRGPKQAPPAAAALPADLDAEMEAKMIKMQEFSSGLAMLKARKAERVSNLTCVLRETGMFDADDQINLEYYMNVFDELPVGRLSNHCRPFGSRSSFCSPRSPPSTPRSSRCTT